MAQMAIDEELLEMLGNDDPQVRYLAFEQLRDNKESSKAVVEALYKPLMMRIGDRI